MTITIDYKPVTLPPASQVVQDDDEYGDACSILVPVDIAGTDALRSVMAGGAELKEDDAPLWSSTATYAAGDRVYLADTHRVYESAKEPNTGKDPALDVNRYNAAGVATWWIEIGPTNRYAMFDGLVSSQTRAASPLTITLTPGPFNGFALFGIDADSYSVEIRDEPGGQVVYEESNVALDAAQRTNYYDYFYARPKPRRQFIRAGLQPFSSGEITLKLYKQSGDVRLGMFAIGDLRPVGIPQRGASVQLTDYSYVKLDAFGNATVKKRANSTNLRISTKMLEDEVNAVLDSLREVQGVPVVVVGSEAANYEWLTAFGLVSGEPAADSYPFTTLNINVKGFI